MIKVSIIVPCYNVENYIDRCISSLINQTLKEIEIILINDGSTDKTEEIIKKYLKDSRIKYFNRTNHGIGNTRNFGLKQAVGEYIGFVDSDDYIELNMFELLYQKAKEDSLDIVVCDFYRNFEETKIEIIDYIEGIKEITNLKENPVLLNKINLSPWNKLYKKDLININKENFMEKLKYEDAPFVINMLVKANTIGKIDKPLYHYAIHQNSETTIMNEKVFDLFEIFDVILEEHKNKEYLKDELDYLIVQRFSDYSIQQRNQKNKKLREEFIDMAFEYMRKNTRNYRKNKYYKNISLPKRIIEKNKTIAKLYCNIYAYIKIRK